MFAYGSKLKHKYINKYYFESKYYYWYKDSFDGVAI